MNESNYKVYKLKKSGIPLLERNMDKISLTNM